MTTGERLRTAIEKWPSRSYATNPRARPTVSSFARIASQRAPGAGTSRAMVTRYITGEYMPPASFLDVAAEVLGVRVEYLRGDDDSITAEEEQRKRARATLRADLSDEEEQIVARIRMQRELLEAHQFDDAYGDDERTMLLDLAYQWSYTLRWDQLHKARGYGIVLTEDWVELPPPSREELDDALSRLQRVLDEPFKALGRVPNPEAFGEYLYTMFLALRMVPHASRYPETEKERATATARLIGALEKTANNLPPDERWSLRETIELLRSNTDA